MNLDVLSSDIILSQDSLLNDRRLLKYSSGESLMFSEAETYNLNTFEIAKDVDLEFTITGSGSV